MLISVSLFNKDLYALVFEMDFLKSAVASAISKGPPFPYVFGDRVNLDQSIWTLYNGTRKVGDPDFAAGLQLM